MTRRRGAGLAETRPAATADPCGSNSPPVEPASSIDILRPRWPPLVETVPRRGCSALSVRLGPGSAEPIERRADRRKLVTGRAAAWRRANPDRDAAAAIDFGKTVFIGRVVAQKYRHASLERRLGHEGGDHLVLAVMPGLKLDDHFARDQTQRIGVLAQQPHRRVADRRAGFGSGAI